MHSLADDLARELGDRLRLSTPVTTIEHGAAGVSVCTATGSYSKPARAIVAVPPVMASRIAYAPPLPNRCRVRSAPGKAAR